MASIAHTYINYIKARVVRLDNPSAWGLAAGDDAGSSPAFDAILPNLRSN